MDKQRHSVWSVTINNPNEGDEECIAMARQKKWIVDGQKEMGANGTIHYQLIVKSGQQRFSALKKAFPRGHIEPARNVAALEQYVHKEDTKLGELTKASDRYPTLSKLWSLMYQMLRDEDMVDDMGYIDYRQVRAFLEIPAGSRVDELRIFDWCIGNLICDGYYVETMGINPQIRGAWSRYSAEIMGREHRLIVNVDRQTDSQENSVAEEYNHAVSHEEEQEVYVSEAPSTEHASP